MSQTGPAPEPAAPPAPGEHLLHVPLAHIRPNPRQPRRRFAAAQISALARSIGSQGVLQPLLLRPHPELPGHYELVAGERRLRALRLLGWPSAPAIVRAIPDHGLLEAALVENLQREQLNPVEEAQAYRALLTELGYTQESLARRLGRDRSTIANTVRLLALPPAVLEDLEAGRLTSGHARALLAVEQPRRLLALRTIVLGQGLSVRETEALAAGARARQAPRGARALAPDAPPAPDARWLAAQERLERLLGTRVLLEHGAQGGSIRIEFHDTEDFNRLFELLTRG